VVGYKIVLEDRAIAGRRLQTAAVRA
jgi:hypothetical protein